MEAKLKNIMDWLTKSGMKVNEAKTDVCLFHRGDTTPISLNINGTTITSNTKINILGVIFDSKLQWSEHISHAIKRATGALNAIRLIRNFFTKTELLQLITSNFYSILFYNSEIWQLPSIKASLKQKLLSISARALKVCNKINLDDVSFLNLHKLNGRSTPDQMMLYKLALSLFRVYNTNYNSIEFTALNFNQILTSRQTRFKTSRNNKTKVGLNSLANRFHALNDQIPLEWLNDSYITYKVKCKNVFIK